MIRLSLAVAAALFLTVCATSKPMEASATIEEIPNEPSAASADAGPVPFAKLEATEGFSVMMPGPIPEPQRKSVPLKEGEVVTASWSANVDGIVYSVSLADYPEKVVRANRAGAFLNEGRDGLTKSLAGTVRDEQAIEIDGHPGKSYTVVSDKGEVRARNFLVGNRLYTLIVLYSPNFGAPRADEFLNSLTLTMPVAQTFKGSGVDAGTMMGDGGTMMDGAEMTDAADAGMPVDAGTPAKPKKKKK